LAFLPKKHLNFNNHELARAVRFNSRVLEWISFFLPRKTEDFSSDIYPPCKTNKSNITMDEWAGGANKDPELMEITESTYQGN